MCIRDSFINSLKVTAIFTGIEVPVQVLGALVIAAFISKNNKRNKFLRAVDVYKRQVKKNCMH